MAPSDRSPIRTLPASELLASDNPAIAPTTTAPTIYSAPRRFDTATMLVVSTAYALLFAFLNAFDAELWIFLTLSGLVTFVGAAQPVLFRGDKPREASVIAGGVFFAIGALVLLMIETGPTGSGDTFMFIALLVTCLPVGGVLGMPFGYLAGAIVGGVFLISDNTRRVLERHGRGQISEPPLFDDAE